MIEDLDFTMLPLKLVCLNTYLISKKFSKDRETFPLQRARRIKDFIRDKDLCFLQEVWGTSLEDLIDESTHTIPPGRGTYVSDSSAFAISLLPHFIIDAIHNWKLFGCGGLYDLSAGGQGEGTKCIYRSKHTFTISRSRSLKGVEATLWKIPRWGFGRQLLVFNVHLDPSKEGAKNRQHQIAEVLIFMDQTTNYLDLQEMKRKNDSDSQEGELGVDWTSRTGVLLLGDFNIKASTFEYQQLLQRKEWNDFFEGVTQHTYDESNTLVSPAHTGSNNRDGPHVENDGDYGRIDFIFGISRLGKHRFLPLKCLSRSIETQGKGQELSDHYPLVVQLIPEH